MEDEEYNKIQNHYKLHNTMRPDDWERMSDDQQQQIRNYMNAIKRKNYGK